MTAPADRCPAEPQRCQWCDRPIANVECRVDDNRYCWIRWEPARAEHVTDCLNKRVDWRAEALAARALLREVLDLPHVTPVNGIGRRIREHLEKLP